MATRKHKKSGTRAADVKQGASQDTAGAKDSAGSVPNNAQQPAKQGLLTPAQLSSLIFLSLGVSRLLQIGAAVTSSNDQDDGTISYSSDTVKCRAWLGEEICRNDEAVTVLLRYKFLSAVHLTLLIAATMLHCCKVESFLATLNALLLVSPVATTMAALYYASQYQDWIPAAKVNTEFLMGLVLFVLAVPTRRLHIPFVGGRRQPHKTLQSLCLMTLFSFHALDGVQVLWSVVQGDDSRMETALQVSTSSAAPVARLLWSLVAMDKVTCALVYAFGWYYMEESRQRTFLLTMAALKALEYYYQIPILKEHILRDTEYLEMMTLLTATLCTASFCAPKLQWKKKLL